MRKASIPALQCLRLITRKANISNFYLIGIHFSNWKWELNVWGLITVET